MNRMKSGLAVEIVPEVTDYIAATFLEAVRRWEMMETWKK